MTEGWARVIAPGYSAYYVLFFIHLESRRICLAGVTRHPNQEWMEQMARNVTMEDTIQEDPVKRLKYLSLAFLVASLLAIPAMAQRGRSNRGGATRGIPRSDQVQAENKRTDKDSDPTKGSKAKKDRKSTRLNSSHVSISYAVFCLKKKKKKNEQKKENKKK